MAEELAYSLALDLLFNGQDMDYCQRPICLSAFGNMTLFEGLSPKAAVGVIGPGGGRLLHTLNDMGFLIDAFEGRIECKVHLQREFANMQSVRIYDTDYLNTQVNCNRLSYEALICMDDLRSFRTSEAWTDKIQRIIRPGGYFVYSQVSNKLPGKELLLADYFEPFGTHNVSSETAELIRDSYLAFEEWNTKGENTSVEVAQEALDMIQKASTLRRSILSGVEVSYCVWMRRTGHY